MRNIIDNIIASKATCYFISPHLDDAAYSAGALISELSKTNKVIVINVFTGSGQSNNTYIAKRYLDKWKYDDAKLLYQDRVLEDRLALSPITNKIVNLGFIDILWRQKSSANHSKSSLISNELNAIYSTSRLILKPGIISNADEMVINAIKESLLKTVETDNSVIFCPLAQGKHIDHLIVRKVCDEIFTNLIHWSDYPYNLEHDVAEADKLLNEYKFSLNLKAKEELVKKYKSQYNFVIGDKQVDQLEEYFYISPDLLASTKNMRNLTLAANSNKLKKV